MATASSPSSHSTPAGKALDLIGAALLVAISVLIYLPALNGRFLWDDPQLIHDNVLLRSLRGLWQIWTTTGSMPTEEHYWPLQYTFLWVEWQLWRDWTAGYHAVNMVLNGLVGIQIWRLMRRLALPGGWIAAALFVVHPVHAEVVAWIFSVKDLLATLLFLGATELFLNHQDRGGWKWLALAAIVTAAAMLIKTSPLMLPFALAILTWYRRGQLGRRDAIGVAVLAAITFSIALVDVQIVRSNNIDSLLVVPPFLDRLLVSGKAFAGYWEKLIMPVGLSPIYPKFEYHLANPIDWLPLVGAGLITFFLWITRDRLGRGALACWLFYGVTLGPALGIVYFGFLAKSPIADRYQYLPSIGPIIGIGALIGGWIEKRPIRSVAAIALVGSLGALTWAQSRIYRDEVAFFSRALETNPDSVAANYGLGKAAWTANLYPESERFFGSAYRLDPRNKNTLYALGRALASQKGKTREAVELYSKEIDAGCVHPNVWANLAWLLATSPDPQVRDPKRALKLAEACVARAPKMEAEFLNALAAAQAATGDTRSAATTARAALALAKETDERHFAAKLEKAIVFYDQGKPYIEQ